MRRTPLGSGPRKRTDNALADALAVWHETRATSVAEAVDALTDLELATWPVPAARLGPAFQAAWLGALHDPIGRGWAAKMLFERLVGSNDAERSANLALRLRAADDVGPDPRIAVTLASRVVERSPLLRFSDASRAAELVLFRGLDERTRAMLVESQEAFARRALAARHETRAPTRRELERFSMAARTRPTESHRIEPLLRAAIEDPDDDTKRSVLADELQASGDLRGELMALQLADREPARVDQILRACAADWLGPLREIAYRAEYRRGLLARLELDHGWCAKRRSWAEHARDPILETVEELVPGTRASGAAYREFLMSPTLASLRRIEVFDRDSASGLAELVHPIEHVACAAWRRGLSARPFATLVLPACERIASITSLGIVSDAFKALARSKLLGRLTRLVIAGEVADAVAIWPRLPAATEVVIGNAAALSPCVATWEPSRWELRLVRSSKTAFARGVVDVAPLTALGITSLELEVARIPPVLASAAKANRIELVHVAPRRRGGFASKLH